MITFREFLIHEDLNGDIEALRLKIGLLTNQKAKLVKPIDDQLAITQKMLASKVGLNAKQQKAQKPTNTMQGQPSEPVS